MGETHAVDAHARNGEEPVEVVDGLAAVPLRVLDDARVVRELQGVCASFSI
mgnify:CR=1 FL=1